MTTESEPAAPLGSLDSRPLARAVMVLAPIAVLGNAFSSLLRYPDIGAAVVFIPYAALTAALVVSRRRDWIWFILITSVAHFITHWPQWSLSWVLFADLANIARALVAAVLLRQWLGVPPRLESIRALLLFAASAVLIAPAVGATLGAASVVWHGASQSYTRAWLGWFVSNALTGIVMLPVFIELFTAPAGLSRFRLDRKRLTEAGFLVIALAVTCAIAFLSSPDRRYLALPLYAPLPVLIWAALRFGTSGASLALAMVTVSSILSVDRGTGPFLAGATDENIIALQVFVVLTTAPVMCLAAMAAGRRRIVELYQTLLASLHDHVAILDANGVVLEVNDSWRRYAEASDAHRFHRLRAGDDYVQACRDAAATGDATAGAVLAGLTSVLNRTRRLFQLEYDLVRDTRRESHTLSVEALERSDGGAVVTRSDVTARRQAQVEIETQRRELSHLARVALLGQLSGAIAHELNQPLTAILSNAEAGRRLLRRQDPDLVELGAIMQDIAANDQRAAAVIRRLRALLKRGDKQIQPVDAADLVSEVLELSRTELMTRHVRATSTIEPALPSLLGDKVQLQQVLLNLILNGCEAMSTVAASKRLLVLTAGMDSSGRVHFAVRDTGTGIPHEVIDRLFEPFVTTKPDGLGLGLSISQTIVAAHGGQLWAENNPDGGATIHCLLPGRETSLLAKEPGPPVVTH